MYEGGAYEGGAYEGGAYEGRVHKKSDSGEMDNELHYITIWYHMRFSGASA